MANLNRVFIIGNLCRDPEMRYTPKGTPIAEIALAINRIWTDEENKKREEVTFVDVILWARQAEIASQYLRKGSPLFVEGRLQLDTWDDKQTGQKRSKLRVVGEHLQLLGSRQDNDAAASGPPSRGPVSQHPAPARAGIGGPEPVDIPYNCDRG
jgi:single-strand DNA-binding protein